MKTRIVLWGENAQDEKILIAVELLEKENQVKVTTFPELVATEEFYTKMMNIWREGNDLPFPEGHTELVRELSITDGLLPDDIKTMRSDILNRAKTEWHFVVLSSKLYQSYNDELEEVKERIEKLTGFDGGIWEELKGFWNKVQKQSAEKNLFRKHSNELRNKTNGLFEQMKGLKKALDAEFERASKETVDKFYKKLDDIEARIEQGLGLHPIFNELKDLQRSFKDVDITRKDRNHLWKRTDKAFKKVKEKKYGKTSGGGGNSALSRVSSRYDGLLNAINKMQQSINRDKKDQEFQQKRIENTDGQLELQIRQAKMAMIIERLKSKEEKLQDMLKTKTELEQKMESEKKREEKRQEKKEAAKVKEQLKEEIASEIKVAAEARKEDEEKLVKAAESLKKTKKPAAAAAATVGAAATQVTPEEVKTTEEEVKPTTDEVKAPAEEATATTEEATPTEEIKPAEEVVEATPTEEAPTVEASTEEE
jgi:hypothetical protein